MLYLMKSKYAIFSNIKVTKSEHSAFWGDTRYRHMLIYFLPLMFEKWKKHLIKDFIPNEEWTPNTQNYTDYSDTNTYTV